MCGIGRLFFVEVGQLMISRDLLSLSPNAVVTDMRAALAFMWVLGIKLVSS